MLTEVRNVYEEGEAVVDDISADGEDSKLVLYLEDLAIAEVHDVLLPSEEWGLSLVSKAVVKFADKEILRFELDLKLAMVSLRAQEKYLLEVGGLSLEVGV